MRRARGRDHEPADLGGRVADLLLGRWLFCRGGLGTFRAGIAFAEDGSYRFLEADGSESPQDAGRFVIVDTSMQNGPGAYQVNFYTTAGDGNGGLSMPIFSNAPLKMLANDDYKSVLAAF